MSTPAGEVDQIVDAWRRERSDLDFEPLQVLSRVTRLARLMDQARGRAFTEHHLEVWEFDVLSALRRVGEPYELSPGALVQQTLVTSGTMTNRVDRLEQRGYVRRRPSPTDRRGILVQLTPAGLATVDGAMAALLTQERSLLSLLPAKDRNTVASALRTLLSQVESSSVDK